jgi:hypothetical protein
MTEKDGGQAFPQPVTVGPNDDMYPAYPGMTLRDYFAGQALIGMGTWAPLNAAEWQERETVQQVRAQWAYEQADEMLLARSHTKG